MDKKLNKFLGENKIVVSLVVTSAIILLPKIMKEK